MFYKRPIKQAQETNSYLSATGNGVHYRWYKISRGYRKIYSSRRPLWL